MASHYYQEARGIRKSSAIIAVAVLNQAENLFLVGVGRTVIIRKIIIWNGQAANAIVSIGINVFPAAIANIIPNILAIVGFDSEWQEDMIPEVEINQNITVASTIALVEVQIEVEEILI